MATTKHEASTSAWGLCALAAVIMAYGWGYRGTVGHEAGAMVPGALLGLALCLASGRPDWYRRAAVAGLCGAVGWAWGGQISYMEQTFYSLSDSFPNVLYGYTMLFFIGALWAGCGGAILGLAFTESRSYLARLAAPFTFICGVFLVVHLFLLGNPELREANETFTVRHFHDGDWLSATITLVMSAVFWLVSPRCRKQTALFFCAALGWWVGYGLLTKLGGLRLAPWHRSESWGGVLGILIVLVIYLMHRRNRAALMLCLYGILGGGIAFALAVFLRHPLAIRWGPFATWGPMAQWRFAEDSFGFFMGLALALGALRLICGGLAPPEEDTHRARLDVYAVFVMLIALPWINFRRHMVRALAHDTSGAAPFLNIPMLAWFLIVAALATAPALYVLYRYLKGDRQLAPSSSFGKGVAVTMLLLWVTVAGQLLDGMPSRAVLMGHLLLWVPAVVATWLLVRRSAGAQHAVTPDWATTPASDMKWRVGRRYWVTWALVPVLLLSITKASTAIQDEPYPSSRKRFGPHAYWRQTARFLGTWQAAFRCNDFHETDRRSDNLPVATMEFGPYRDVTVTLPSGERVKDLHRWFLRNQYTWLQWREEADGDDYAEVPLEFREGHIYIAWPPGNRNQGYLVLERVEGSAP